VATDRAVSELALDPGAHAPRAAREFAGRVFQAWHVPDWNQPAGLVVSELVTNAVQHAGTLLTLRLVPTSTGVVVEVDDAAAGQPRLVPTDHRTGGGLGLAMVDRLAEDWGFEERPGGGKTVWARLRLTEPAAPLYGQDDQDADEVLLELPWDRNLAPIARTTVAQLGSRAGFTRREVEDLRLAADEMFALVIARDPDLPATTVISCRFEVWPGRVRLTMTSPLPAEPPTVDGVDGVDGVEDVDGVDDFARHLLKALVDELAWVSGEGRWGVRAEKHGRAAP
jgi:anti-sigma regulatory factor (Ser/Thr protein kinase)